MNVKQALVKMEEHVTTTQEDTRAVVRLATLEKPVNRVLQKLQGTKFMQWFTAAQAVDPCKLELKKRFVYLSQSLLYTLFSLNFASTKFRDFRDFEKKSRNLILAKYRGREV